MRPPSFFVFGLTLLLGGSALASDRLALLPDPSVLAHEDIALEIKLTRTQRGLSRMVMREVFTKGPEEKYRRSTLSNFDRFLWSLSPAQRTRLEQLTIQREGYGALLYPAVVKTLGLKPTQVGRIRQLVKTYMPSLPPPAGMARTFGGPPPTPQQRAVQLRFKTALQTRNRYRWVLASSVRRVLTPEQMKGFERLRGPLGARSSMKFAKYDLLQLPVYQEELRMSMNQIRTVMDILRGREPQRPGLMGTGPVRLADLVDRALSQLTAKQQQRLEQLTCQKLGPAALQHAEAAKAVGLTHDQYAAVLDASFLSQIESLPEPRPQVRLAGAPMPTYAQTLVQRRAREAAAQAQQANYTKRVLGILNPTQRKKWAAFQGAPMKAVLIPPGL